MALQGKNRDAEFTRRFKAAGCDYAGTDTERYNDRNKVQTKYRIRFTVPGQEKWYRSPYTLVCMGRDELATALSPENLPKEIEKIRRRVHMQQLNLSNLESTYHRHRNSFAIVAADVFLFETLGMRDEDMTPEEHHEKLLIEYQYRAALLGDAYTALIQKRQELEESLVVPDR